LASRFATFNDRIVLGKSPIGEARANAQWKSMSRIDPTARIEDGATIGDDVSVGPYCVVGKDVTLGADCRLLSHVNVAGHTTIGAGTLIYPFASVGTPPQSLAYRDEPTRLVIGESCTIRESVTINTGTVGGGGLTLVGDRCYLMAFSHVGHDCKVGNDVVFANSATLGGHCEVGNFVWIGGLSAVHQFVRVGAQAMVAAASGIRGDVIPYGLVTGQHAALMGLNVVGMRRRKFTRQRLHLVRSFYRSFFFGPGTLAERLSEAQAKPAADPAIAEIIAFVAQGRKRSFCLPRGKRGADPDPQEP
jgi:UDP-N-acetylglucosamine acyltransferase